MLNKKNILLVTLAAAAATALVLTQNAASGPNQATKLEGAWIAKVPGTPLQWSYVMSPSDPSGKRAVISGSLQVAIPVILMAPDLAPDFDYNSPFSGESVMTERNTAKFTTIGYSIKKVVPSAQYPFLEQVALIWVSSGEIKFTAPGKAETTHHVAFYLPAADGDGDGIPDADAAPFLCLPPTISSDTRLNLMPPCTP